MKDVIKQIMNEEMPSNHKTFYFMAGLPRAGSTLLSSLLNQNPRFYSGPSSPVTSIMLKLEELLTVDELFLAYPKMDQARELISSVIHHYYSDVTKPVIFDKNRSWVNRMHYIPGYFGIEPKVLCPVRNVSEILASFITMHHRNPFEVNGKVNFIDEMLIKSNTPLTDDNRCTFLASPNGILGQSYNGIKQALMEGRQKQIHFIEYDDLMNNPRETMRKIYDFLGEEYFEHNFDKIENVHQENDGAVYGLVDMHHVRNKLNKVSANPRDVLSPFIMSQCENAEFWRDTQEYIDETLDSSFTEEPSTEPSHGSDTNIIGA